MELWYTEEHSPGTRFSLKASAHLYREKTPYQQLDIIETEEYGRVMLLDGLVMFTEKDEFVYHELITHLPLSCLPAARRVLIIGGGDGGTVRETCRHDRLETVELVEIDAAVVTAAKKFFPALASRFDDPRLTVHFGDGMEFVRERENRYDLIIVDSTDPIGPGKHLFTESFYRDCHRALGPRGLLVAQGATPFSAYYLGLLREQAEFMAAAFERLYLYLGHIPTYPTGTWSFLLAAKGGVEPLADFQATVTLPFADQLQYYHPGIHRQALALPAFVLRELGDLLANRQLELA